MNRVRLIETDEFEDGTIEFDFEHDGSIEHLVKKFRAFALAISFTEETVDNWIKDPYDI